MTDLVIAHLYPGLLRTYGDRDNVVVLARRAEWRGFSVRIEEVDPGDPIPAGANVIVLGGGTDAVQRVVGQDIVARADEVRAAIARGAVVLGVCGGFQLLGRCYVLPDGRVIEGMGVLDVETRAARDRIVGRVRGQARLWRHSFDLVGFENHAGRTTLGPDARPLASVPHGHGNNGHDRIEGAAQTSVVGTYLHGPVLAINPALADAILGRALAPLIGTEELDPLDDTLEQSAHEGLARRVREDRRPARRRRVAAAAIAAVFMLGVVGSSEAVENHDGHDSRWFDVASAPDHAIHAVDE
jgi:lipid II isoglutaminyl synthase (glutamine-hydrolysing)